MGILQSLGLAKVNPDFSEAQRYYRRMMNMGDLEKLRTSRMQDWQQQQKRAFGDISQGVAQRWGGTGATNLGIESSLPGQWETQGATRWMQDVGNPAMRGIEQSYLQSQEQRSMQAQEGEQQLRQQAIAEARAKQGNALPLVGTLAGAAASFIPGVGSVLGPALMGLSNANYKPPDRQPFQHPSYNWNFDPQYMNMQGMPQYYPGQQGSPYYGPPASSQTQWT